MANDTTTMQAKAKLRFIGIHPGPFESGAILPGSGQKKKFGFVIPMIEAIDTSVVFAGLPG
ncbi:hypothetical protein [Pseudomonas fluorescens]|uniref:Uncharacterized protein n=1 Tax=Pseudomonas fluorescens TaxID=294 RepID=A0A7Z3C3Y6_PSEFL|nr:hypothetical protein [Pseudomonas fluorescens]QJP95122.1 hypothetical protein C6Y56_11075 [Pseudomonas fluorescens]